MDMCIHGKRLFVLFVSKHFDKRIRVDEKRRVSIADRFIVAMSSIEHFYDAKIQTYHTILLLTERKK